MLVHLDFISGVSLGVEYRTKQEMGDEVDGWYLIIDLFIVRILFDKE